MSFISIALAIALQSAAPAAPPPLDCNDADHRAFDFWVGDWDVSPTGSKTVIARSRIEKIVGCAISETFEQTVGPKGQKIDYRGRSISTFDPAAKGWQQLYVDSAGNVSLLRGGVVDRSMVLKAQKGAATNRMTFTANADGSVRQSGATSADGTIWTPTFDFTYRPRIASSPAASPN